MNHRRILIGIGTGLGIAGGITALAAPVIAELQQLVVDAQAAPDIYALGGIALAALTMLGRFGQAIAKVVQSGRTDGELPPPDGDIDEGGPLQ